MAINHLEIDEDAQRLLANMGQRYDAWLAAERIIAPGRLTWKTVSDKDYLYRIVDGAGNGRSLGPRSEETEAAHAQYESARRMSKDAWNRLLMDGGNYRQRKLPTVPSYAGEVLRHLDVYGMLGDAVLVVGTNALSAYALEAHRRFPVELSATDDFDLTWVRRNGGQQPPGQTLMDVLRKADNTWTVNQERPFQALNSKGDEIELLLPASLYADFSPRTGLRPIPLPEQDWLLPGQRVEQVVVAFDRKPVRLVAPDPRWFALHKLWLSDKPARNPHKKPKDHNQGITLLDLIESNMPHYPLDDAFADELPSELRPYFDAWRSARPVAE